MFFVGLDVLENIPGVEGIGDIGAVKLITKFGTIFLFLLLCGLVCASPFAPTGIF